MKKFRIVLFALIIMLSFSVLASQMHAVSRGGTIVVRVPYQVLDQAQLVGSWWGSIDQAVDERAEQVLFPVIPPMKVAEYLLAGDFSGDLIRTMAVSSVDSKALVMNKRPLDDNLYLVLRPEEKFGSSFDLYWSVSEWSMSMQDTVAHGNLELDMETQVTSLSVTSMDGIKPHWQHSYGGFSISLFEVSGVYVAVIEEPNARKEDLRYTQLYIDAPDYDFDYFYMEMDGYLDGGSGIYCTVLSEAEANLLQDKASVRLEHDHARG